MQQVNDIILKLRFMFHDEIESIFEVPEEC